VDPRIIILPVNEIAWNLFDKQLSASGEENKA
jgi:hypothetical protein